MKRKMIIKVYFMLTPAVESILYKNSYDYEKRKVENAHFELELDDSDFDTELTNHLKEFNPMVYTPKKHILIV